MAVVADKEVVEKQLAEEQKELPAAQRAEYVMKKKLLVKTESDFNTNLNDYQDQLLVAKAELTGMDESFLQSLEQKEGKLKAVAVLGSRRSKLLPEVPALSEAGVPTLDFYVNWLGYFVPRATPKEIIMLLKTFLFADDAELRKLFEIYSESGISYEEKVKADEKLEREAAAEMFGVFGINIDPEEMNDPAKLKELIDAEFAGLREKENMRKGSQKKTKAQVAAESKPQAAGWQPLSRTRILRTVAVASGPTAAQCRDRTAPGAWRRRAGGCVARDPRTGQSAPRATRAPD